MSMTNFCDDMAQLFESISAGKPIPTPEEISELAEQVANQPPSEESIEDWANRLAEQTCWCDD